MRRAVILAVVLGACDRGGSAEVSGEDASPSPVVIAEPKEMPPEPLAPPSATSDAYAVRLTDELFWIDRAALTEALAEALVGRVRVEQAEAGWTIVEVRAGSLAEVLGLRVGDVVRTVDTHAIPDADAWLAVVRSLQLRESFAVAIDRGGRPMTLRYELRGGRPDALREVVAQVLAIVKLGVHVDGDRIAIDRAILRQLGAPAVTEKLRRTHRRDLLGVLGLPPAMIVAVADTSLSGVDEATAALGRQAGAREFNVDLEADGTLPSRRVVVVVEGRIDERDLEAALARLPTAEGPEPAIEAPTRDPVIPGPGLPEPGVPEPPDVDAAAAFGIVAVDETHFTMSSKRRDELLADPSALAKSARVIPAVVDGAPAGFKLYGIRRGTLPKAFGIKNGDMITAINGLSLESAEDMLDAYKKVRKAKKVVVEIERKGKAMSLTITFE